MNFSDKNNDTEIIQKILSGEIALFEVLIRRYNSYLYKIGRTYNYNHEDVEDLMQETFIQAYTNLSGFENRSSFKTWIIRIMLNNCYKKQQKFSYRNEVGEFISEKSTPMFTNQNHDTAKKVLNRELGFVIENALNKIPVNYRIVFSLREMNGLSVREAADALNITEVNVKVRLNRAKALLRKEMEKSYRPEDIYEFNLVYCDAMVSRVMNKIGAK